jgi:hypothetical protein
VRHIPLTRPPTADVDEVALEVVTVLRTGNGFLGSSHNTHMVLVRSLVHINGIPQSGTPQVSANITYIFTESEIKTLLAIDLIIIIEVMLGRMRQVKGRLGCR